MSNRGKTLSGEKNIVVEAGKYTLATFEYATLIGYGVMKGGVAGTKHLMNVIKGQGAKFNNYLTTPKKALRKGGEKEDIKVSPEQGESLTKKQPKISETKKDYLPKPLKKPKKTHKKEPEKESEIAKDKGKLSGVQEDYLPKVLKTPKKKPEIAKGQEKISKTQEDYLPKVLKEPEKKPEEGQGKISLVKKDLLLKGIVLSRQKNKVTEIVEGQGEMSDVQKDFFPEGIVLSRRQNHLEKKRT